MRNTGLSLALLNFYQTEQAIDKQGYIRRGKIILWLLEDPGNIIERLKKMNLKEYLAFQLCVFAPNLSKKIK